MVAVEELKKTCAKVSESRSGFLVDHDFQSLVEDIQKETNLKDNAQVIRREIAEVMRVKTQSDELSKGKVLPRIGNFLRKLIPFAKLSLGLASTVGEVRCSISVLIVGFGICTSHVRSKWTWYYPTGIQEANARSNGSYWSKRWRGRMTFTSI
jgi:hypothetical protein